MTGKLKTAPLTAAPEKKQTIPSKSTTSVKSITPAKSPAPAKSVTSAKSTPSMKSTPPSKPSAATQTAPSKNSMPQIEFSLTAPDAKDVFITGEFNNWNVSEHKMRRFKDGVYKKSLKLHPGRYEYLFIVDGNWWTDPNNPERVPNSFGTQNSVINIKE